MDALETKTLVLREDKRLPNRYVCASPTGKTVLVGTDTLSGEEVRKPVMYRFSKGQPVPVHVDDFPILRKLFHKKHDAVIPFFTTSAVAARASASPAQRVAQLADGIAQVVEVLQGQGIELPEDVLSLVAPRIVDEESEGSSCKACGNLHPSDYKGVCLRCNANMD